MPRRRLSAAAKASRSKERYGRHREDAAEADTSTVSQPLVLRVRPLRGCLLWGRPYSFYQVWYS